MPEWNHAEELLANAISYHTDEDKQAMYDELHVLHRLFHRGEIFSFMDKYLRFPNMETTVIDYDNARGLFDLWRLDQYREDSGY